MSWQTEYVLSHFLHGSIFCLGIYMSISMPSIYFWKRVISAKWRSELLIHNISSIGHGKSFPGDTSIAPFWHRGPRLFPRVTTTKGLKTFCEFRYMIIYLRILYKIWSKGDWLVYYLSLLFTHLLKRSWSMGRQNQKYLRNRLWTPVLVRAAILYQTFYGQTQSKPYCSKILMIWDSHLWQKFAFCLAGFLKPLMIYFCSMPWVAGWFPLR